MGRALDPVPAVKVAAISLALATDEEFDRCLDSEAMAEDDPEIRDEEREEYGLYLGQQRTFVQQAAHDGKTRIPRAPRVGAFHGGAATPRAKQP